MDIMSLEAIFYMNFTYLNKIKEILIFRIINTTLLN